MPREIDDAWIEQAIESYRRIEQMQASYERALSQLEVCVRSPDGCVEIVVGADGKVRRVEVSGSPHAMSNADLARAIHQATSAAHEAAEWARRKLHEETFADYRSLGAVR